MKTLESVPSTDKPQSRKKVSFGAIAKKAEKGTATNYPAFVNAEASLIAARIIQRNEEIDGLTASLEVDKAELKQMVTPFYFQTNHGKSEVPSSVAIQSDAGEVLIGFQNRYPDIKDEAILDGFPDIKPHFSQHFAITVDGNEIPESVRDTVIAGLQALFQQHDCLHALTVKESIKPSKEFHALRHKTVSPAENVAFNNCVPIVAMVKAKSRRG